MTSYRIPSGGLIDRGSFIDFTWEGKRYQGHQGDTLASALLANGVGLVGRSFKYHRPRGIIAAGLDEPNAIIQLEDGAHTVPNLKATYVDLYPGLKASPVNAKPSVENDRMAVNGLFKRFIPAAFYYKTFMWPNWHLFEPSIRKAAGLGVAPEKPDPDYYEQRYMHCDVLVVGGGIAGLRAALLEAAKDREVVLVTGGALWGGRHAGADTTIESECAQAWIDARLDELRALPNVTLLSRTLATGYYDHGLLALCERLTDHLPIAERAGPRQRLWKVRAAEVVLATGAIERPLVFPGNDVPGVMLAGGAQLFLRRHGVAVGRNVLIATNNDSAWDVAFELDAAGVRIAAIVDARPAVDPELVTDAKKRGIEVVLGAAPSAVKGGKRVKVVHVGMLDAKGRITSGRKAIVCDALLMSGGWNPAVHLHSQAGGSLQFDDVLHSFVPDKAVQTHRSVGAAAGDFPFAARGSGALRPIWSVSETGEPSATAWVDFQNDVTAGDVALAARENFVSVEHLKRYTTLGMASDQGKTSNVNGIGIMSELLDRPIASIGTTRFRPPYDPTTIGIFAGHRVGDGLHPRRLLAAHASHVALGAHLEEYGGWMRPASYRRGTESEHEAVSREVLATRANVGIFDASPLGKIEVKGPDAAAFLDRIYVNTIRTLKPGKCRYGLMLNENGIVYDDGIVTRLADDHFIVGTTSGHASAIAENLQEWLQCEWPDLEVLTEDVTTSWGVVNLAGPRSREVLAKIGSEIDLSVGAFPHMSHFEGRIGGISCRVARVSFSGELSWEVAVPWDRTAELWQRCLDAGSSMGITPFGLEALMAMRIEKGFLHVGTDTDGMTLPQDIGFGAIIEKKKGDFIGRRSAARPDGKRRGRRQLVGLEALDSGTPLPLGAHILDENERPPAPSRGWVTSSVWSPTLALPVALGMVERGSERRGETVSVWDFGKRRRARIVDACRYDIAGDRLSG